MGFSGLERSSFDPYAPDKASSNVHNLARMRVKDTLLDLAATIEPALREELAGLARAASDEVPNILNQKKVDAQWIYWFRDAAEREALASFLQHTPLDGTALLNIAAHDKHALLAFVLRHAGLWIGLRVGPGAKVDRKNLARKLQKSWERERFLELLRELPEACALELGDMRREVASVDAPLLEEVGHALEGDVGLGVGHNLGVDDAVGLGRDLSDQLERWLGALVPLYRFAAWRRDNDHIEASKQLQAEKELRRKQATGHRTGDRVRIVGGLFSGKLGVVEAVDTKAQVRVRVGTMSVVVPGSELVPV